MGCGRCWPSPLPRELSSRSPGPLDLGLERHFSGSHSTCAGIGPRSPHLQPGVSSVPGGEGRKDPPPWVGVLFPTHPHPWLLFMVLNLRKGVCKRKGSQPDRKDPSGAETHSSRMVVGTVSPQVSLRALWGAGWGRDRTGTSAVPSPSHLSPYCCHRLGFPGPDWVSVWAEFHSPPSL